MSATIDQQKGRKPRLSTLMLANILVAVAMLLLTGSAVAISVVDPSATPTQSLSIAPAGTPLPSGSDMTAVVTLRGHVLLQGRPTPPDPLWSVAVSGTLSLAGGGPAFDYLTFTDPSGYYTVTTLLAPGDYLWHIQSAQTLANGGTVSLAEGLNVVEIGTLRTGDANGDNCVNVSDFTLLRTTYGKSVRDLGYDPRADFDDNDVVDIADFTLLRANFGQCGAAPISTPTPTPPLPPDPAQVAPPLDPYVATDLLTASAFLYSGPNPIQTGVVSGTIELTRVAVLRGRVLTRDEQPLAGVMITVLDHPEFGQTRSRADGMFDLAVNGGGRLTLHYGKDGYLTAQRQVQAPWQDYKQAPDVVLIPLDPNVTVIDLQASSPMQVAYGSVVSDTDGMRQQRLFFPAGTTAVMTLPGGLTQPLTILHVRSTEYTVGATGPEAMPGDLPPNSAYTYAAEFSVDEARAAGAGGGGFNPPILSYQRNFLDFPVGGDVPIGYYDKTEGMWVAGADGRVIAILSVTGGLANLDTDGDGQVDNGVSLGVTTAERQTLATLYAEGGSLWRVPTAHFTPWDYNWPYGPPFDAGPPPSATATTDRDNDKNSCEDGSIIGCQDQTLGEVVDLVGVPFQLHYQSERMPGHQTRNTLHIPISEAALPASLRTINVEVAIAGRTIARSFTPTPNQRYTFTWDGLDGYGRAAPGCLPVQGRTRYVYPASYQGTRADFSNSFGRFGSQVSLDASRPQLEIGLARTWQAAGCLGGWAPPQQELGGWSLSVHHAYDPNQKRLYLGTGGKRSAQDIGRVINTAAGNGTIGYGGDGGPATQAQLRYPTDAALAPDGTLYLADQQNHRIRRIGPDGIITTVAGNGNPGFSGDGGPATQARLYNPYAVALGPDGSLYIADSDNHRVRRVGPDGIITTVAGTGSAGFSGDDGPATAARLANPSGVAVGPDGALYIADTDNNRVRQVGTDGIIVTVAGSDSAGGYGGDGGPAWQARLYHPIRVVVDPDGVLYIADLVNHRVRRVGVDGTITTLAGTGVPGYSGDGGPATQAQLYSPIGLALDTTGGLYIADSYNSRIRHVGTDGIINSLAGTGASGYSGDGGLAGAAQLNRPTGVRVSPGGDVYVADTNASRLRRIAPALAGLSAAEILIPAEDGSEVYVFNGAGRHLRTLDALTNAVRYRFTYDPANRLVAIADGDNNITTIERDPDGRPTAIISPYNQRTTLTLGPDGYLASVTNPAEESTQFEYRAGGLLASMTDPREGVHQYEYDPAGRLIRDENPAGGVKTLARVVQGDVYTVTVATLLTGTTTYTNTYRVERLANDEQRRVNIDPAGLRTETLIRADGSHTTTAPDGTSTTISFGPDPRWGMQAPLVRFTTYTTPGGRTGTITQQQVVQLAQPSDPLSLQAMTSTTTINGQTFATRYTAATRGITTTTAAGRQSFITLDAKGRPIQTNVAGLASTQFAYDGNGRLISTTQGSGVGARTASFLYNSAGYAQTITDPIGSLLNLAYDAVGRVLTTTLPDGRTISYSYDANSNLTSLTPPGRPAHGFTYTPVDQTEAYIPPAVGAGGNETRYIYNRDRQLDQVTRPDEATITVDYDNAGRVATLTHPGGTLTMGYDAVTGNLLHIAAPGSVTTTYSYDGALPTGTTWTGPIAGSVSRTFNNNLRIDSESVNGGNTVSFQYDQVDLLRVAGPLTLTRNPQNGLLTGSVLGTVTDTWGYNSFGEMTSYSAARSGAGLYAAQYGRDNLGRIITKTEMISGVTSNYTYTYDLAGRLTNVVQDGGPTAEYSYDANGNRLAYTSTVGTVIGDYDDQDRLLQYGTTVYTYTANGELLSKIDPEIGQTTYNYDVLGNLRAVTLPNGTLIEYLIDGQNRRIGKQVQGVITQSFLYADQLRVIAELTGTNTIVSRFVYGSRGNVPDYMIKNGVTYRIIADHLGSPRLIVNTANGQIMQRMDYDAFGNVLTDTNPGFQPLGFAGGLYDRDSQLVRFGVRDYDAEIGRWTVKDPIGLSGGDTNFYAYVVNNPINNLDPRGTDYLTQQEIEQLLTTAQSWQGTDYAFDTPGNPYKGAGATKGVEADCSGSTWRIFEETGFGYGSYANTKTFVSQKEAYFDRVTTPQTGDVVLFYNSNGVPQHMGIVDYDTNWFWNASQSKDDYVLSKMNSGYWGQRSREYYRYNKNKNSCSCGG